MFNKTSIFPSNLPAMSFKRNYVNNNSHHKKSAMPVLVTILSLYSMCNIYDYFFCVIYIMTGYTFPHEHVSKL